MIDFIKNLLIKLDYTNTTMMGVMLVREPLQKKLQQRTSHKGIGAQPRDAIGGFVHKNGCIGTIGGVVAKVSSRECDDEPLSAAILCRFLFREILRAFLNHEDYDYVESKWFVSNVMSLATWERNVALMKGLKFVQSPKRRMLICVHYKYHRCCSSGANLYNVERFVGHHSVNKTPSYIIADFENSSNRDKFVGDFVESVYDILRNSMKDNFRVLGTN
ncbi:hypothetical protein RIR_jg11303.t1 [Rhizophagus irregularis DAOM 181602=DAOM 197198]|nr:hypothetical protein RIR_jg11303.t1 [Rhizophagus irregularis DAOM 181602=DAOM 197198]